MYRKDPIVINQYYHIFNRWYDKKNIFLDEDDYERFLKTIIRYQKEFPSIIFYSYSLLPNHFHFLLNDKKDDWNCIIPDFMRKLQNSYSKYFNIKNNIKWQFFEWRYKANIIQKEKYLFSCISYINANPIKHWIVKNIEDWKFSSYLYLSKWTKLTSTPVLDTSFWNETKFDEIYNKYFDSTPVLSKDL